ncbi:hypothetical protein N781_14385 [Pontibacillus halophilus JSM 076056 = DSM 19796]|uniref:DUF4317 domain-containing protein n=1 Tax=Pontibacillus halophilus JSM 076056 = DSM 19796 TaxID=1385510 RepID=A0A0A5G802_9BACI|nr:DUF4317 domain-containing protein [Pontibacillus halophilus]KGX87303.1 hypothetical protein N781_14385 [Pontibacillus halophilus JSM 076056 = DSM 19796]
MDKKDIAGIRKQLKVDQDLLKISHIFNVYILKETTEVFHQQSQLFEMLERDQQELFMNNFKKLLSGQLDEKLFELKFMREAENHSQLILHKGLLSQDVEDWKEQMLAMTEKMIHEHPHEHDIVVTFIRAEYNKPMKKQSDESDASENDTVYSHPFILCSVNKTQDPKKDWVFDYVEKEFKYNIDVDPVVDLKSPLGGFMFPTFTDHFADVNHILYSSSKAHDPDVRFTEEVLNAEEPMTAKEDKAVFEEVIRDVVGDQLNPSTLANVYREVNQVIEDHEEDDEPAKLDYKDVERVLTMSGEAVDGEQVKTAFKRYTDNEGYELKASSVVPKYKSKSIKINTKVANISISPQDLEFVKQVNFNGKRYVMVEVEEDAEIEGFKMLPEAFGGINDSES